MKVVVHQVVARTTDRHDASPGLRHLIVAKHSVLARDPETTKTCLVIGIEAVAFVESVIRVVVRLDAHAAKRKTLNRNIVSAS